MRSILVLSLLLTASAFAADAPVLPVVPGDSIAKKKELLFSDDFERTDLGKAWGPVVPTFTLENGALKGMQTRVNAPAADGKPAVAGHAAVIGSEVPTKDSVVEFKFRFEGASNIYAELDDRKYTGSHYGHICRVVISLNNVRLGDDAEGAMRNDIYAMSQDSSRKEERAKLLIGRSVTFPVKLETGKWYTMVWETVGDRMRAVIDGKPVAFLKSPGIAHPTKSKIELGVSGKNGFFDDIKIWNAEAAE